MSYVIFLWEILTLCFAWFKKRFSTLHNTKKTAPPNSAVL